MKERLVIKNFGPIKDIELELGRFNILIGEQATGKSTVAKLLAVCRYFSYIVDTRPVAMRNFWIGLEAWGLSEALNDESYMFYQNEHYSLKVEWEHQFRQWNDEKGEVHDDVEAYLETDLIPLSSEFKNLLSELEKIKPESEGNVFNSKALSWIIPTSFFQNEVAAVMDNPFYLPAERGLQSIFSLGKSSIQNLSDALFTQLAKMDGIARLFTAETPIEPVDIIYKNVNGQGFIRKKSDNNFYSLFNAATGYQSVIPIVLAVKYYNTIRKKRKTFIIEEPELNLFPDAQKKLIEYLVDAIMNNGNSILLTTHSPYILTSTNNLLYAFNVGMKHEEETKKIVEKKYWLDPREFSIYKLNSNGTCEDIFDKEEEMIRVEEIDKISEKLNADFDKMMNIEFVEK